MEGNSGENMVAIIQSLRSSGLAVTLMSRSQLQNSLKKSKKAAVTKTTVETNTECAKHNSSAQIHDGTYTSSYQLAHCRLLPSSPAATLPEFPLQKVVPSRINGNFEVGGCGSGRETSYPENPLLTFRRAASQKSRGADFSRSLSPTDSFVGSLRKYSLEPLDRIVSSELVQRLLNHTQAKHTFRNNVGSLRSLRGRHSRGSRDNKDKKTTLKFNKNTQTYTRNVHQSLKKDEDTAKMKEPKKIKTITDIKSKHTPDQLNPTYNYLKATLTGNRHTLGQTPEVRYLNDVKQYIRQTMDQMVPPPTSSDDVARAETQAVAGPSRSKDFPSGIRCGPSICPTIRNRSSRVSQPKPTDNICPSILNRYTKHRKSHHRDENIHMGFEGMNNTGVQAGLPCLSKMLSVSLSRCHPPFDARCMCKPKVSGNGAPEIEEQILEWLKDVPVYADEPLENKAKREEMVKDLVNKLGNLAENDDYGNKFKEKIEKFIDNLPIWSPGNEKEQEMYKNKLANILSNKLVEEMPKLKDVVSKWLDGLNLDVRNDAGRRISNDKLVSKFEQHLEPILKTTGSRGELKHEVSKMLPKICAEMGINVENEMKEYADKLVDDLDDMKKRRNKIKRKFGDKSEEGSNNHDEEYDDDDDDGRKPFIFPKEYQPETFPIRSAERKHKKDIMKAIQTWVDDTLLNVNSLDDDFKKNMISDLAGDIVDRQKYLQLNLDATTSSKEELEHLKYQIYRWLNKSVGDEDLASVMSKAQALMDKIKIVAIPQLSVPETANADEAIEDVLYEWIDGMDFNSVSPADKNKLEEKIPDLVGDIQQMRLNNQIGQTQNILDSITPMIKSVKTSIGEGELLKMSENLKSSLQQRGLAEQSSSDPFIKKTVAQWVDTLKLPEPDDSSAFKDILNKAKNNLISTLSDAFEHADKVPLKNTRKKIREATSQFFEKLTRNPYKTQDIKILADSPLDMYKEHSKNDTIISPRLDMKKAPDVLLDNITDRVDNIPIENKKEQEMHKNKPVDILSNKLVEETPKLKDVVSKWLDGLNLDVRNDAGKRISNDKLVTKFEQHLEPILKRTGSRGKLKNEVLKMLPNFCAEMGINVENEMREYADELVDNLDDIKKRKDKIKSKFGNKSEGQPVANSPNRSRRSSKLTNKGQQQTSGNRSVSGSFVDTTSGGRLRAEGANSYVDENDDEDNDDDDGREPFIFPKEYHPETFPIKSAERKHKKDIMKAIQTWVDDTLLNVNSLDDDFKKNMISDLAGDIVDRQKYLQLNPDATTSSKEELEHLKYQIYRWLNKSVGDEDLASIMSKAQALMDKVKTVAIPQLSVPETANAVEAIEDVLSEWIDGMDFQSVSPADKNKLEEKIPDLVGDIQQMRLNNQIGQTQNILDSITPFIKSVKTSIGEGELLKMGENLKSSLQQRGLAEQSSSDQFLKKTVAQWVDTLKLPEPDDPSTFKDILNKAQNNLISTLSDAFEHADKVPLKNTRKKIREATSQFFEKLTRNPYKTQDINILSDSPLDMFEEHSEKDIIISPRFDMKKTSDLLLDDVADRVENIPIETNTSERKKNAGKVKQHKKTTVVNEIDELNMNPEISNDDFLHEKMLQDKINDLLTDISNVKLKNNLPTINKNVMEKVKGVEQNVRDVHAEKISKQEQNEKILADSLLDKFVGRSRKDAGIPLKAVKKKAADALLDDIADWVENIPIEANTPERKNKAKNVKQHIKSSLINKIGELNMNPQILHDDFLYEKILQNDVHNLLKSISSENVKNNLPTIMKDIVEKVKRARQKARDVHAEQISKQEQNEKILADSLLDKFDGRPRKDASVTSKAVKKKTIDVLLDEIADWVENIPIEANTPERKENSKNVKQHIKNTLINKIEELNMNPEVMNDDFLYEKFLHDDVHNLLTNISSENVKNNLPTIMKDLMKKVKRARHKDRDVVHAVQNRKQQQNKKNSTDSLLKFDGSSRKDADVPLEAVKKRAADILLTDIADWVKNIPIEADTLEKKERAEKVKQHIESKLIHKIGELNMNPEILNDDFLYEEMLQDEVDNLLTNISSENVRNNIPTIKKDFMEKVKEARQKIRDVNVGQAYKQQLREDISKTLPFVDLSADEQALFEVLKDDVADAFVNMHYVGNDEELVDKLKQKINSQINKFCNDYLKTHSVTPLDTQKLNQDLYNVLKNVSEPENESFRDEVELLKIKDEVKDWAKELPLKKQTGQEKLQMNKTISVLAKKLYDIEYEKELNPDKDYDEKIQKEIIKFMKKLPLTIQKDEVVSRYADKLLNNLKDTKESRKLNASTRYSLEPDIDFNSSYLSCLSVTDHAHLERIRERTLNAKLRCTPKDTSVSPRPIDVDSQTEIMNSSLGTCPGYSRLLAQQSVQTPCQSMQAVGSQVNTRTSPHVVIKEYYWDSTNEASMTQPTYQSPHPCSAFSPVNRSPCVSMPEELYSTPKPCLESSRLCSSYTRPRLIQTRSCGSQDQIPCTPSPCMPAPCQVPYRSLPCKPEQNLRQTQRTHTRHQYSPNSTSVFHPMAGQTNKLQRPSSNSTKGPCPATALKPNMPQQEIQSSRTNAPKPCIVSTPCSQRPLQSQLPITPQCSIPQGRSCGSQYRIPCSPSTRKHWYIRHIPLISSEDDPELSSSCRIPRVTRLGSFDNLETEVCNSRHRDCGNNNKNNYEYWERNLNKPCIASDDGIGRRENEEGMKCRCKQNAFRKCCQSRHKGCQFHCEDSIKSCSKCCGVHCPYPSYMFFK